MALGVGVAVVALLVGVKIMAALGDSWLIILVPPMVTMVAFAGVALGVMFGAVRAERDR